jgi:hypothetical protein
VFGLGTGFVDVEGASADLLAVQRRNGFFSIVVAGHFHETKAAGTSRIAVGHDAYPVDLPIAFEQLAELIFPCIEAEIPHENILHALASALSCRECEQFGGLAGRCTFLRIRTGAGEQSIAACSIAGWLRDDCQI